MKWPPIMYPKSFACYPGDIELTLIDNGERKQTTVQSRSVALVLDSKSEDEEGNEQVVIPLNAAAAIQLSQSLLSAAQEAIDAFDDDLEIIELELSVTTIPKE